MATGEKILKKYLELKNLDGWKEYRALCMKKVKKVNASTPCEESHPSAETGNQETG